MRTIHWDQTTQKSFPLMLYTEKTNQINLQSKTLASEMSLTAAASTMFLMTNFLIPLSLGTQRAQLVQRMGCTCPRPFLARPLFLLFLVYETDTKHMNYKLADHHMLTILLHCMCKCTKTSKTLGKYLKLDSLD